MSDQSASQLDRLETKLARKERAFRVYLEARAAIGVVLLVVGVLAIGLGAAMAGVTYVDVEGTFAAKSVRAALTGFIPTALGAILTRTGWAFVRHRKPDECDTGCLNA